MRTSPLLSVKRLRRAASTRLLTLLSTSALTLLLLNIGVANHRQLETPPARPEYDNHISFSAPIKHETPQSIEARITFLNSDQYLRVPAHLSKLGQHLSPDDVVIVVQVHDRVNYLRHLIESLRHVRHIESALIIFSHDLYDESINTEISLVNFTRYLQIFYPYSLQIYKDRFPGTSLSDCKKDMTKERATAIGCANADYPDTYGHYREAEFTSAKHHWWWKANRVFDRLAITRNHSGAFVFIEEDHYLAPDSLHMLRLMRTVPCHNCHLFSLGNYITTGNYKLDAATVQIENWASWLHNMGLVITRTAWNAWRHCATDFCTYDDYNWDWSLQHMTYSKCLKNQTIRVIVPSAPRVFHIGRCGLHHAGTNCSSLLLRAKATLKKAAAYLFVDRIRRITVLERSAMFKKKINGGWSDPRDHQLCLSFLNSSNQHHGNISDNFFR